MKPTCWCRFCWRGIGVGRPFIVCPECGNKRCPKATHHDHECSGSNEVGQSGSVFGDYIMPPDEPSGNPGELPDATSDQ